MYGSETSIGIAIIMLIVVAIAVAYVFVLFCVSSYANRLGREAFGFVLLALFFTPLIAFWGLYMLGETNEHRELRIIEEEKWRRSCHGESTKENHDPADKEGADISNV